MSETKRKQKSTIRKILLYAYVWRKKTICFFLENERVVHSLFLSSLFSLVITLACIIQENIPNSYLEKIDILTLVAQWFEKDPIIDKNVLFIDTSMNQQSADCFIDGKKIGSVSITDRELLYNFLKKVKNSNYKFIFLDIIFERTNPTKWDPLIKAQMDSMSNILVAKPSKDEIKILADTTFNKYGASVSYHTTFLNSNYTREIYIDDKDISASFKMYNMIHKDKMIQLRHFYFPCVNLYACHKGLFMNCPILKMSKIDTNNESQIEKLGNFVYNAKCLDLKNKILVVGDFKHDMHGTYLGFREGPFLVYQAYKGLESRSYYIPYWLIILMYILDFLIALWIVDKRVFLLFYLKTLKIIHHLRICLYFSAIISLVAKTRPILLFHHLLSRITSTRLSLFCVNIGGAITLAAGSLIVDFVWYSIILSVFSLFLYSILGQIFSVVTPAFCFAVLSFMMSFLKKRNR